MFHFFLELAGGPAGVAYKISGVGGLVFEQGFDFGFFGGEEYAGENIGVFDPFVAVENHEGSFAGAALVENAFDFAGFAEAVLAGFLDADCERTIEDEAERALVVVLDHEDDGSGEIGVGQSWGGEEKFALGGVHDSENDIGF